MINLIVFTGISCILAYVLFRVSCTVAYISLFHVSESEYEATESKVIKFLLKYAMIIAIILLTTYIMH